MPDVRVREQLDRWPVARLATLGADGFPHQVPIVFARIGNQLFSPIDGKPKSGRELARVRNCRERPQVNLLLDEYDADWTKLWWISIAATARVGPPDENASAALRAKYPQYERVPLVTKAATMLSFRIDATLSWCAGSSVYPVQTEDPK